MTAQTIDIDTDGYIAVIEHTPYNRRTKMYQLVHYDFCLASRFLAGDEIEAELAHLHASPDDDNAVEFDKRMKALWEKYGTDVRAR